MCNSIHTWWYWWPYNQLNYLPIELFIARALARVIWRVNLITNIFLEIVFDQKWNQYVMIEYPLYSHNLSLSRTIEDDGSKYAVDMWKCVYWNFSRQPISKWRKDELANSPSNIIFSRHTRGGCKVIFTPIKSWITLLFEYLVANVYDRQEHKHTNISPTSVVIPVATYK